VFLAAVNCLVAHYNLNLRPNFKYCCCKSSYSFIAEKKADSYSTTASSLNCFAGNYFASKNCSYSEECAGYRNLKLTAIVKQK